MDDRDLVIGLIAWAIVGLIVFGALPYGAYRYGRFAERRALTDALANSVSETYHDGYKDGNGACLQFYRKQMGQ